MERLFLFLLVIYFGLVMSGLGEGLILLFFPFMFYSMFYFYRKFDYLF